MNGQQAIAAAITQALEYFEQREDADHDGDRFVANEEMQIAQQLREALATLNRKATA